MQSFLVSKNQAGQRLDKLLMKYLNKAPKSFLYKMLRKKNITLNGRKATGSEIVKLEDEIKLFLSDETINKFTKRIDPIITNHDFELVYEDDNILVINKPVGLLSQKATKNQISLSEQIISYLLESKQITQDHLQTFRPAICNRLDRNTSGLIIAGKTLSSLQILSKAFHKQTIERYYLCIVIGRIKEKQQISGYLKKDPRSNHVIISEEKSLKSSLIKTEYQPISYNDNFTLLKVKLITGKSHQIRAHLASIGHPILGDFKYGNKKINEKYKIKSQLLHSWELILPDLEEELNYLSHKKYTTKIPEEIQKAARQCGLKDYQKS